MGVIIVKPKEIESDELNDVQRRAAQLIVLGLAQTKIASTLDVTPATLSVWKSQAPFAAYLARLRADARAAFKDEHGRLYGLAVATLGDLMQHGTAKLRLRAAETVFRRGSPDDSSPAGRDVGAIAAGLILALKSSSKA